MPTVAEQIRDVDSRATGFRVAASKAIKASAVAASTSGGRGSSVFASTGGGGDNPFGDSQELRQAERQYGAFKDIAYTAIRPAAVKLASLPIRVGRKAGKLTDSAGRTSPSTKKWLGMRFMLPDVTFKQALHEGTDPLDKHPILDLFDNPAMHVLGGTWGLKYCTACSILATGWGIWWIDRGRDGTEQVYYVPKHWATPIHSDDMPFVAWKIQPPGVPDGEIEPVPDSDILAFALPDPANPLAAYSPMQAQAKMINTDDQMQKAQNAALENIFWPGPVITLGKMETPSGKEMRIEATPEQRQQLVENLKMWYAGARKYGEPFLIDQLVESITQFGATPADLPYDKGSSITERRILEGFGTNPIVAGRIEGANRASAYVAHETHNDLVVNPIAVLMSEVMTVKLGQRYSAKDREGKPTGEKLYVWVEKAKPHDADLALQRVTAFKEVFTKGAAKRYVMTGEIDLPPEDDDDEPVTPPPPEPAENKPPGDDENEGGEASGGSGRGGDDDEPGQGRGGTAGGVGSGDRGESSPRAGASGQTAGLNDAGRGTANQPHRGRPAVRRSIWEDVLAVKEAKGLSDAEAELLYESYLAERKNRLLDDLRRE